MTEKVTIGNCELYLADSREVLPSLVADALICDPPYGVGLGSRKNNNRERESYTMFDDTAEYVETVAVPIVEMAFLRGPHAAPFLWKHLGNDAHWSMDSILQEFGE